MAKGTGTITKPSKKPRAAKAASAAATAKPSRKPRAVKAGPAVTMAGPEAMASGAHMRVRHYCLGFGDCHLLSFPRAGERPFFMLIDCGNHPSLGDKGAAVRDVVADLASVTGGHIDVLVITHEHMDHLSAFDPKDGLFSDFTIDEVWFGWTEDPKDDLANDLDLFRAQGELALAMASDRLAGLSPSDPMADLGVSLQEVRGFYASAKGSRIRPFRETARALARKAVRHFKPGDPPMSLPGVPDLNIYVLGPPRDPEVLKIDERASELYKFGSGGGTNLAGFALGTLLTSMGDDVDDPGAPFDPEHGHDLSLILNTPAPPAHAADKIKVVTALLNDHYRGNPDDKTSQRRRIDGDWLGIAAELALQLDRGINNTSLVLAFEFGPDRRVALFPGDAQVGNWLSWPKVTFGSGEAKVDGADLMARTVYLKIAHHGSHNGTLKEKGLERMTHRDLSAYIPSKKSAAVDLNWHKIPFEPLLDALSTRTNGRILKADSPWLPNGPVPASLISGSIKGIRCGANGLYVEVDVG